MIDFNIFNILKLIVACESCAIIEVEIILYLVSKLV